MRRLWLLFTQTVTVCLGIVFVVTTLRPDWVVPQADPLPGNSASPVQEAARTKGDVVANADVTSPADSYADAVARAAPSVVSVYTRKHINVRPMPFAQDPEVEQRMREIPGFNSLGQATSLGSGVIARDGGYILTNYHVVEAADAIEVTLSDGRQAKATLVGADPESDLAVVQVQLPGLVPITLADESALRVGDVVLAIGNPFGVGQTTTLGIVSALGRNRLGVNIYENYIQTDAAINPGNSGGALVDTSGRLVGINTAIYSENGGSLGIGFAIPAPAASVILSQIIKTGHVIRGWLGVEPQDITAELAQAFDLEGQDGVILARVFGDGPAARAGLQVGDIVVGLDAQQVTDAAQFLAEVAALAPDTTAEVHVLRNGIRKKIEVQVGARPPAARS